MITSIQQGSAELLLRYSLTREDQVSQTAERGKHLPVLRPLHTDAWGTSPASIRTWIISWLIQKAAVRLSGAGGRNRSSLFNVLAGTVSMRRGSRQEHASHSESGPVWINV